VEEAQWEQTGGDMAGQLYERYHPRRYRLDVRQAPLLHGWRGQDGKSGRWLLLLLCHHLALDHTTLNLVVEEIQALLEGKEEQLAVPQPYRNYVAQTRLGVKREEQEAFFRGLLGDVEEPTAPFGLRNVQGDGSGVVEARQLVEAGLAGRLRGAARRLGVSAASVCHLAWGLVVGRASGRQDVVFGTVLLGRLQGGAGAERVLGMFINTLPVRLRVGAASVEESLRGMQEQLAELLRHEHAPLALAQRGGGPGPVVHGAVELPAQRGKADTGAGMGRDGGGAWGRADELSVHAVGGRFGGRVGADGAGGGEHRGGAGVRDDAAGAGWGSGGAGAGAGAGAGEHRGVGGCGAAAGGGGVERDGS
jgi:hypothetical protein